MKRTINKLAIAACGVALFTAATALAQTPAPLPANCVAWWRAEGNANDSVGTNNGTLMNGVTFATGEVGQGFSLDGVNDYIEVPHSTALNPAAGSAFTIEGWIKPMAGYGYIAYKGTRYGGGEWWFWVRGDHDNLLDFGVAKDANYDQIWSTTGVAIGQWQHVAVVVTSMGGPASGYTFYINGQGAGSWMQQDLNVASVDSAEPLRIGAYDGSSDRVFNGQIDELALYNRALSATEIAAIYAAGSAGKVPPQPVPLPANCVAWWRAENNFLDSIGTNNGTGLNGVTFTNGEVGQGFNFDGNNGYVSVPSAPELNFGPNQDFTVAVWIHPNQLNNGYYNSIIGKIDIEHIRNGQSPRGWYLWLANNTHTLQMQINTNGSGYSESGSRVISTGVWTHVAMTRSGTNLFFLVNGTLDLATTMPSVSLANSDSLVIGAIYDTHFNPPVEPGSGAKGGVDDVVVFNRALSSNEIAAIYAAGSAGMFVPSTTPPSITSQPQSRTNAFGTTVTFTVTATGDAPLSYQWRKGGSPLANAGNVSGANTNQLTIANVAFANSGSYDVVVSNLSGSVTSAPVATLTITQAVAGVSLSGLARTYNGSAQVVTATTTPAGLAYTVTYNGSLAAPTNAGSYAVVATVTDPGYTGGANGTLVIDKATQTIVFGPLPPKVIGEPPFTLSASVGGVTLLSGYSSQNTSVAQVSGNTVTIMGIGSTLITATKAGDANHYAAPDMSQTLVVSGVGASITQPPVAQVVGVGGQATFTVTAAGTGPLHYQWYFNNVAIGGATDSSYTINNATPGTVGTYRVMVWNSAGTNTSAAVSLGLDALKMYAGVNAYGPVGSNYVVQFTTNLTAPVTWTPLQSFTIVTNPTVIIDYNSPEQPKRFYRTLPQ